MASPFESATRVAIAEIIQKNATESKYGYLLTTETFEQLVNDLFELLSTSRSLKAAGDRLIAQGFPNPLAGDQGGRRPINKGRPVTE